MKTKIRFLKMLFGIYEPDVEYWIPLSKIKITRSFRHSRIGDEKYRSKWKYYTKTGELEM